MLKALIPKGASSSWARLSTTTRADIHEFPQRIEKSLSETEHSSKDTEAFRRRWKAEWKRKQGVSSRFLTFGPTYSPLVDRDKASWII